jgi:hypothetical protein
MRTHEWKQLLALSLLIGSFSSLGFLTQTTRAIDIEQNNPSQAGANTPALNTPKEASLPLADDIVPNPFIETMRQSISSVGSVPGAVEPPAIEVESEATLQEVDVPQPVEESGSVRDEEADALSAEQQADKKYQHQLATIAYLQSLPDAITVELDAAEQSPDALLRTVQNSELEEAGFYFNDKEVFRFRSKLGYLSPYLRSKRAASRLSQHVGGALTYRDVHLDLQDDGNYNLMLGKHVIAVVDQDTADSANLPLNGMAKYWVKQLRQAMGEKRKPVIVKKPSYATKEASSQSKGRYLGSGMASWYGPGFHGRTAADGSRYNMYAMTAAHKTLPFGTKVRVTNKHNGKSCVVRITDRGPYIHGRVIDLSKAAAQQIGALSKGVANVTLEII